MYTYVYTYIYIYIEIYVCVRICMYTYSRGHKPSRGQVILVANDLKAASCGLSIVYICIYIYIYSLIADSSDKGSHGGQKKSIESNVTLQILSAVDSKGTNIGARKWPPHSVTTIVRNGRFVRPDHRSAVTTR